VAAAAAQQRSDDDRPTDAVEDCGKAFILETTLEFGNKCDLGVGVSGSSSRLINETSLLSLYTL